MVSGFTESSIQNYKELPYTNVHHADFTDAKPEDQGSSILKLVSEWEWKPALLTIKILSI